MHLSQLAGLLGRPQRADHRIEQKQEHQHAVLVEVQPAVASFVALTTDVVQACQKRGELVEILQARHVLFPHFSALFAGHADDYARSQEPRNTACAGCVKCANLVPNRIAAKPIIARGKSNANKPVDVRIAADVLLVQGDIPPLCLGVSRYRRQKFASAVNRWSVFCVEYPAVGMYRACDAWLDNPGARKQDGSKALSFWGLRSALDLVSIVEGVFHVATVGLGFAEVASNRVGSSSQRAQKNAFVPNGVALSPHAFRRWRFPDRRLLPGTRLRSRPDSGR
jgi:hypothetical protein